MKRIIFVAALLFVAISAESQMVRVRFTPEGKICVYNFPWYEKKVTETNKQFMDRKYRGIDSYKDMNSSELPNRTNRDKWRWNLKDKEIYVDESIITKKEKYEAKTAELDTELKKETPDPVKVISIQREREKIKQEK